MNMTSFKIQSLPKETHRLVQRPPQPQFWGKMFPPMEMLTKIAVSQATKTKPCISFGEKCSINIDM